MPAPEICVLIVNYGTADLTIAAVESVRARDHGGRAVDIHVVDNASPGDDAAQLTRAHADGNWGDGVTLYLERENHGFGRGNNVVLHKLAAQEPPPDKVFLLNPDATLDNDAIAMLADFLDQTPKAGVVGAGIAKPDGANVTAAFRFPNAVNEFAQALNFGPVARLCKGAQVPLAPDHPQARVDWVAGAAVMFRMQTLRDADFFDPAYFLYFEEVDLMRQAHLCGWETWYIPAARVFHAEGAATGVKSGVAARKRKPPYWYQSWRYYYRKNHGTTRALLAGAAYLLGTAGNHVIAPLRRQHINAPLHAFGDFWRHVMLPLIRGADT